MKLGQQMGCSFDGAGDELGKEAHIGEETHRVVRGRYAASIYVDRVAERLERIEGDPHRQQDIDGNPVEAEAEKSK